MNIWRVSWSVATVAVLALVSVAVPTAGRAVGAIAAPSRHVAKQHTKSSSGCKPKVKAKGTIVWSDSEFPSNISPYQGSGAASGEVEAAYLEGLDTINSQGRFIPDLLQSLPKLSGLTVHAQLKHGMRWSNGQEITAADVAFGWRIGMSTLEGTSWCSGACDVINSIRTQGKYGLVFHLKHRSPTFISSALYYLPVWPPSWKGGWSSWNVKQAVKKLFGDTKYTFTNSSYPTNGAYQVTGFFKNDRIVLKPMKYYHIMTCGAGLKKLIFAAYNNKDDMIAGAASRATDITTDYTWDDLKKLASYTRVFKTLTGPSFYFEKLEFNVDPKFQGKINPLSKVKVRQALALAIDKVGLIRSVMGMTKNAAQNIVAWDPLILTRRTAQPFADKAITGQWDPIRHRYVSATGSGMALADAKKLLKQAGYPGGNFTVQAVTTSDDPTRQNEFSVLQNNWARVGVNFSAKYVDSGTFFGDWQEGSPRSRG
ncbi:MAG: ABC transporter substrate-binding protein, partial [Chloroflexota bacterium]